MRRSTRLHLVVALALVLGSGMVRSAAACGDLDAYCRVDEGIRGWAKDKSEAVGAGLGQGVIKELQPLIDKVMAEQLPTIINQINQAVAQNVITMQDGVNILIAQLQKAFNTSFDQAMTRAQTFVDNSVNNTTIAFRREVLDTTASHVHAIQIEFFDRLDRQMQQMYDEAHCLVTTANDDLTQQQIILFSQIDQLISRLPFTRRSSERTACHNAAGIPYKAKQSDYSVFEAFSLWQCALLGQNNINTPASTIQGHYTDISSRALEMICLSRKNPEGRKLFEVVFINAQRSAAIWRKAVSGE